MVMVVVVGGDLLDEVRGAFGITLRAEGGIAVILIFPWDLLPALHAVDTMGVNVTMGKGLLLLVGKELRGLEGLRMVMMMVMMWELVRVSRFQHNKIFLAGHAE